MSRTYRCFFVCVVCITLAACAGRPLRSDATQLAAVGRTTLETTASFYGAMQTIIGAMLEEELLAKALRFAPNTCAARPPSEQCNVVLANIRTSAMDMRDHHLKWRVSLDARRTFALRLTSLYDGLAGLAEKDLSVDLASKSGGLLKAVNELRASPLPAVTGSVIENVLGELGTALQNEKLRKGEAGIETVVVRYREWFDAELPAWTTVSAQWLESATQNAAYLLEQQYASLGDASEKRIAAYGLQPGTKSLTENVATEAAMIAIASLHGHQLSDVTVGVATVTQQALARLGAVHQEFPASTEGLAAVEMALAKAKIWLDLIDQWKADKPDEPEKTTTP